MRKVFQSKKFPWVKVVIYVLLAIVVIWLYFYFSKKATSYADELNNQTNNISNEIGSNYIAKISTSDQDALSLGLTGETLVKKGFTKLGLLTLEEAIKKGSYRDLYLYTASVYFSQNDTVKALECAIKARDADPIYAPTYELLTQIYTATGDAQNAEICYNKSKEFSPEK